MTDCSNTAGGAAGPPCCADDGGASDPGTATPTGSGRDATISSASSSIGSIGFLGASPRPAPSGDDGTASPLRSGETTPAELSGKAALQAAAACAERDADFIMFHYKIDPCPLGDQEHDWATCPWAHPGEKARRRSPRDQPYLPSCCPDVRRRGRCPRGESCGFAHSVFEIFLSPARFRTRMCRDGAACSRAVCFFAHNVEQLRTPSPQDLALLEAKPVLRPAAPGATQPAKPAQQQQQQQQQPQQSPQPQQPQQLQQLHPHRSPAAALHAPMVRHVGQHQPGSGHGRREHGHASGAKARPPGGHADVMADAQARVAAQLLSLQAQQERADMLRAVCEAAEETGFWMGAAAAGMGAALPPSMLPGSAAAVCGPAGLLGGRNGGAVAGSHPLVQHQQLPDAAAMEGLGQLLLRARLGLQEQAPQASLLPGQLASALAGGGVPPADPLEPLGPSFLGHQGLLFPGGATPQAHSLGSSWLLPPACGGQQAGKPVPAPSPTCFTW